LCPQSERSKNIRELLKWIGEAKSKGKTAGGCVAYVMHEVTEMGATEKTCKSYLRTLDKAAFITYDHPYWKISPAGKKWLERHQI